jgi:hypothetical protein
VKPLPGSALAAVALEEASAALPAVLLAHSTRTFLLARAYAERRSVAFDEEGLFVAAMLHDLGLVPSLRDGSAPFPQVGSRRLVALFEAAGQPAGRGTELARAIDLHMRWFPRWSAGPEAGLLQVGAWMDVLGRGRRHLPATVRADIDAAYPRGELTRRFPASVIPTLGSWRACAGLLVP